MFVLKETLQCRTKHKGYRCLLWEGHGGAHDFDNHTNPLRKCWYCGKLKSKSEFDHPTPFEEGQQVCKSCEKRLS